MKQRYKELHRNNLFIGLTSFFTDTSSKMVYSVMPLFLMSIGAAKTSISLIEGIAESTGSLLEAFSGIWSDKIGKNKPFMIIGYAITAIVTPIYSFAVAPVHILVLRFIERVGKVIRTAPMDSLISTSAQKGNVGLNFGFQKVMDNSGAILGPLVAFLFLSVLPLNYTNIFLWATIPAVLGVLSVVIFVKEDHAKTNTIDRKSVV